MQQENIDTTLRLLQLVALTLPAIAIYMQVLVKIYEEYEQLGDVTLSDTVVLTEASDKPDFALAQWSLFTFVLSAISLIAYIILLIREFLLGGKILIILSLILLAFSVLFAERLPLGELASRLRP